MYSFHGNIIILKGGIDMKQETNYSSPYELDGKLPLKTAFPLGLQHVLAMFAGNLTPILLIAGACGITAGSAEQVAILQNAMLVAGIVTLVQLFSIGPVRMPECGRRHGRRCRSLRCHSRSIAAGRIV